MDISVRVEVQYLAPAGTRVQDVLALLRSSAWVAFMARHISPRLERVSPTETETLERLLDHASSSREPIACAICLDDDDDAAGPSVTLACGHDFHADCVRRWLEVQSSCPSCRAPLPKAFAGRFAVRRLDSAVLLDPRWGIGGVCVERRYVRVAVSLLLAKLQGDGLAGVAPCSVNACVLDERTGERVDVAAAADCRREWTVSEECKQPVAGGDHSNVQVGQVDQSQPSGSGGHRKRRGDVLDDGDIDCRLVAKRPRRGLR